MKDNYSFIIFNEKKNFNKSFNLSKIQILALLFSIIILISISTWSMFFVNSINTNTDDSHADIARNSELDIPFILPVQGFVTKTIKNNHHGIDIACESNTTIQAFSDGIVVFAGFEENYGNTIIIAHDKDYFSQYSHLKQMNVQAKSTVTIGDIIGSVGETGQLASGPHLHFEIWQKSSIIDPQNIIQEYKEKDVSAK